MKKKCKSGTGSSRERFRKLLLIMRFSFLILLVGTIQLSASVYSQNTLLDIELENASIKRLLKEIKKESEFTFVYNVDDIETLGKVNCRFKESTVEEILGYCLDGTNMSFEVRDKVVIIVPKKKSNFESDEPLDQPIQPRIAEGRVTDNQGNPLPGVSIVVKGTTTGITTDANGNYTLELPIDAQTLVFSFVGMRTIEIEIADRTQINVVLEEEALGIDELVVVGYGSQVRKDITGSVATLDGENIAQRSVTNLSTALQGAVAGVSSTRSSSAPGAESTLRIRGITTLEGSSNPLILVDDVPYMSINDVNPADVESMTFLKDAAAAAIYGSRAAAGVIIITTKRAKEGTFSAEYNLEYLVNTPTRVPEFVGAIRHLEMTNEMALNDGASDPYSIFSDDYVNSYLSNHASDPNQYPNTDWSELIIKDNSHTTRHNVIITAGSNKVKTMATFGYETQDALYDGYDYQRYTGRINNDIKITEKFGASLDVSLNVKKTDSPYTNPTWEALRTPAIYSAVYENGDLSGGKTGNNIYAYYKFGGTTETDDYRLYSKFGVYFKPLKGLKISANIAPIYNSYHYKMFTKKVQYWAPNDPDHLEPPLYIQNHLTNDLWERREDAFNLTGNILADYNYYKNDHSLNALAGYEEFSAKNESLRLNALQFELADFPYMSQAPVGSIFDDGTSVSETAYRSFFGRVAYNYKSKYFVQANARVDGSSKFHQDYRWGTFPSVSLGWVLSNEGFMESLNTPLSFFKLRASYGSLGNDRLGNYLYVAALGLSDVLISEGQSPQSMKTAALQKLAIQDITWETTTTLNIGLDANFFNNKLAMNADYFIKETTDMLLDLNVPDLIGYGDPRYNVGNLDTKGWEFQAIWQDKIGEFNYSASFNIYDSKSIIGDINEKELFSGNTISKEGLEYRTWYGYQSDGIFQTQEEVDNSAVTSGSVQPGDIKYKDISGPDGVPDRIINSDDKTELGGSLPRYLYGGTINMEYKGFDLGLTFQGVGKATAHLNSGVWQPFPWTWLASPATYDGNYWSTYNSEQQNLNARYPRLSQKSRSNNDSFSDFNFVDGSYFRVKNVSLGYSIPKNIVQKAGITKLRLYITANDLISFDNYPDGWDPEYGGGYLITKSIVFGLQVIL